MKCPQCGAEAPSQAVFCQKCGGRLPAAAAQPAAMPTADSAAAVAQSAAPAVAGQAAAGQAADASVPGGLSRRRATVADVPEQVLWEGGYSSKAMIGGGLTAALASAVLFVAIYFTRESWWWAPLAIMLLMWIALAVQFAIRRLGVRYKLTNQRFFHERGILRRVTNRIEVIDIDDLAFEQGLTDRLVGVGRIKITSSDRTDPELWVDGIENVEEVFGMIDKARRAERMRRGLSIEAV